MAKIKGRIIVDIEKCKGCGVCVEVCPVKVLELNRSVNSKGYNYSFMARPEDCIGCAGCGIVCPDSCITVYRELRESEKKATI